MISLQPTYGDKPYWASRIIARIDGLWQMAESYHTYIENSPIMTAVPVSVSQDPRQPKPQYGTDLRRRTRGAARLRVEEPAGSSS